MRLGPVRLPALPALEMPRLGLAAFRRRIVFHVVFVLLALATLALAVALLSEEKQRNAQRYEQGFRKSLAEIVAQLRNPAGQLALLNPDAAPVSAGRVAPLMLPFAAIDFDDQAKAQRAVEMAGCARQYADGASLCAAIGSNAWAGGFIYLVANFDAPALVGRERGDLDLSGVTRARITLDMRGSTQTWIAPLELLPLRQSLGSTAVVVQRGQLAGFAVDDEAALQALPRLAKLARPQRDFRGWLWREGACVAGPVALASAAEPSAAVDTDCVRRAYLSIRLPVEAFREALFGPGAPAWPPADLNRIGLRLEVQSPAPGAPLFDSARAGAQPPWSIDKLSAALAPGETLTLTRLGADAAANRVIAVRHGADAPDVQPSPWLTALIRRLPTTSTAATTATLQAHDTVVTNAGRFDVLLTGDLHDLDRALSASATRLAWPVGAMLAAIALAWLIIEIGLIRRVAVLTRRAAALSWTIQGENQAPARIGELDVSDLRGPDELGILAGSLADLLQRVKDGLRREQLRAERERDMWHAVGHEIMSPLQSLMVLHGSEHDASHRYVQRMQQAVRVLYGTASPGEALAGATMDLARLDLDAFLQQVAANAQYAGIAGVVYTPLRAPLMVSADAYSLEDVVTHLLRNADRYRPAGTPITLSLSAADGIARLGVHNAGPAIPAQLLDSIFEYGVSDAQPAGTAGGTGQGGTPLAGGAGDDTGRRGQGLFVAKTYLAKMDGTIVARNVDGGVSFLIELRAID